MGSHGELGTTEQLTHTAFMYYVPSITGMFHTYYFKSSQVHYMSDSHLKGTQTEAQRRGMCQGYISNKCICDSKRTHAFSCFFCLSGAATSLHKP